MVLNKVKNQISEEELAQEEQSLIVCKKFVESASSIYLDNVKRTAFVPYIQKTETDINSAKKCFDMLLKDLKNQPKENIKLNTLRKNEINMLIKIKSIEETIESVKKFSKVYYEYIYNSGIIPYAEQIKKDTIITIEKLELYLALYNNEYDSISNKIDELQNIKENSFLQKN